MGNNLFQFGRGKLIHLDQGALYRELKELVLSVSREGGECLGCKDTGGGGASVGPRIPRDPCGLPHVIVRWQRHAAIVPPIIYEQV